jgi:RimJ/RimL family protein N-acetyltransferase
MIVCKTRCFTAGLRQRRLTSRVRPSGVLKIEPLRIFRWRGKLSSGALRNRQLAAIESLRCDGSKLGSKRHRDHQSERISLKPFTAADADEIFACITPEITRFMSWEPPTSPAAFAQIWQSWLPSIVGGSDLHFVVRSSIDGRCLGIVGLHAAHTKCPELGIWITEDVHGQGFGREAVAAVAAWASEKFNPNYFEYPVAEENVASRRIAESLGGSIAERRMNPKYTSVVYHIPARQR